MEFLRNLADSIKVRVLGEVITGYVVEACYDLDLLSEDENLLTLDMEEFSLRVKKLGDHMASLTPNELQKFVNQKLAKIENPERRRRARLFLQEGIKRFMNVKKE